MKKIYILLTRTQSILSRMVHLVTMEPDTHASIAFDNDMNVLCSAARRDGQRMFPGDQRGYTTRVRRLMSEVAG